MPNDRTIEHEDDVRAVMRSELAKPQGANPLLLVEFDSGSGVSASYSKAELDSYFDSYNETLNLLMNRLAELGIIDMFEL